jgi:hypothetical protein
MFYVGCLLDHFHLRIFENDLIREWFVRRNIDVFVDCRRNDEPAMRAVIGWEVRSSAS